MDVDDPVVAGPQEEQVHVSENDQPTSQALATEDQLSDDNSDWEKTKHKWFENTKPERHLIQGIQASHNKDLSRILYWAFLEEQRRKRESMRRRDRERSADSSQCVDEEKNENLTVGLRSRGFMTAWPLRPHDLQPSAREYGPSWKKSLIPHPRGKIKNGPKKCAFIDLSGERPVASLDQQAVAESSDDDDRLSDTSVAEPDEIAESDYTYRFEHEPDVRPSAQMEDVLSAYLTKIGKEKIRERLRNRYLHTNGYDASADDELMIAQLRPLTRNLVDCLNTLLSGMRYQSRGRKRKRRTLNDWETVMLVASQQGWSHEIIDRATKRCEVMFGGKPQPGQTRAQPNYLANTEHLHRGETTKESHAHVQSLSITQKSPQEASGQLQLTKRRHFCPVEKCQRHRIPFAQLPKLEEHMEMNHGGS